MDEWSDLTQLAKFDGCCSSETISAFFTDEGDPEDDIATNYDLDTVYRKDVLKAREEMYRMSQEAMREKFPEMIKVWRCGGLKGDVTSVTYDKRVAEMGCEGGYYGRGHAQKPELGAYMVRREDVLLDVSWFWPNGYTESEFLVRPQSLQPLTEGVLRKYIRVVVENTTPEYPVAGATVDGRMVRNEVPNTDSISASLLDYTVLPSIREVPMSAFDAEPHSMFYAVDDIDKSRKLAVQIQESGEISPLIVVVDNEGPYILEGGHRLVALHIIGAKSFPALVVLDEEDDTAS